MKVFVIGGTGLVGSYLLPELVKSKYQVLALTRSQHKIKKINLLGAKAILGDIREPTSFSEQLKNIDFIILLAMPSMTPGKRITKKRKEELKKDTNDFFRNSLDLAIQYNVPIILPGGTSFRTIENEVADETWPIVRTGITEIGTDTDIMVEEAIKLNNPKIIQFIYGKIYGNGGLFRFMFEMMKKNRFRILGKGNNFIPNIHAEDAAEAIIKAIEKKPFGQKFIISDDEPVTQKDFNNYMAKCMGKKELKNIPGLIIKFIIGKDLYYVITMSCKVSNKKAKKILGWELKYPSYKIGLPETIKEMQINEPYFK